MSHSFQWRFVALVAGSLTVLLLFTGFHGLFMAQMALPADLSAQIKPFIMRSTLHVLLVGVIYIAVVTLASVFLSHRTVGPLGRIEHDLHKLIKPGTPLEHIKVREGDGLESLVDAINDLIDKSKRKKE